MASDKVQKFDSANWEQAVLKAETPVLVDFWAVWCGPCRLIAPIVEELADEYAGQVKVGKLNVDENPDVANRYGVLSIPTVVLFKGGQPVERFVGFRPKKDLKPRIDAAL